MSLSSPQRLASYHSAIGSDHESVAKQVSLDKQVSVVKSDRGFHADGSMPELKKVSSKKQQEEWDKETPEVSHCVLISCMYVSRCI